MGRFPWQELDEVGDLGRFPVKKRRSFIFTYGFWPGARLRRGFLTRRRGDSGREQRQPGLSTAAVTVNDTLSRDSAGILHFQLAIGAMSGTAAEMCEISLQRVVDGDSGQR